MVPFQFQLQQTVNTASQTFKYSTKKKCSFKNKIQLKTVLLFTSCYSVIIMFCLEWIVPANLLVNQQSKYQDLYKQ